MKIIYDLHSTGSKRLIIEIQGNIKTKEIDKMIDKCEGCKWVTGMKDGINPCEDCSRKELKDNFEPAEPVVLSAEEILEGVYFAGKNATFREKELRRFVEKCQVNYRLERDLELRPFLNAVNRVFTYPTGRSNMVEPRMRDACMVIDAEYIPALLGELENLKPLNQD